MRKVIVGMLTALVWLPNANATPGAATGAIMFGSGAAIVCDHVVRSYVEASPQSDEPWYLVWNHVGVDDVAGFAAGTVCAIPAAAVGAAIGLGVETTLLGGTAAAVGAGALVVAGKGLHLASRAVIPSAKQAWGSVLNATAVLGRKYGQFRVGSVAPSTRLRTQYMESLYTKQNGMDALCNVPLPPLLVGPPWNRRLNPDIEIDHRIPRARGGSDDPSNLQLTHRSFNRAKRDLTGFELSRAKIQFCPV